MQSEQPTCPKCGQSNFKVWKLSNPLMLHWVLNPGLAVNELILGQRLPAESLECRSCELPLMQRNYTVCPHCSEIHSASTWAGRHGFGNWLGLVCPKCLGRIPCLWNVTSILILTVTAPIWYLPYRFYFRDRKPSAPPAPGEKFDRPLQGADKVKLFLRMSLLWGGMMWVIMSLVPELGKARSGFPVSYPNLGSGAVIWALAGIAFGGFMTYWMGRKKSPADGQGKAGRIQP